jgi:hypothetical protein
MSDPASLAQSWTIDRKIIDSIRSPASFNIPLDAETIFHFLAEEIADFEKQLSSDEEIGAVLVSGPNSTTFHITDLGFVGRNLIIFHGLNEHKKPVRLMQHVAQVSVLLTALPKVEQQARRIGYTLLKEHD